jgi:hypothetical protein
VSLGTLFATPHSFVDFPAFGIASALASVLALPFWAYRSGSSSSPPP